MFYLTTHSTHFIYGYMEREREREREMFYLTTHSTHFIYGYMEREREREREMFYLTTHSTHFIYGYMASDIWLRTILIVRKETRCRHIGYSYRLTARVLLYAPSHRQDNTYHGLCLHQSWSTGWNEKIAQWVHPTKDRSDDPSHHERTLLPRSYISLPWMEREIAQWVHPMKDRSDDPSHHERTLLPRSYISLLQLNECKSVNRVVSWVTVKIRLMSIS